MKKLLSLLALALVSIATLPVQAATASGQFDVNITLNSACVYTKTTDVVFNYTSFQASAQAQSTAGAFSLKCTNKLPYTLALDNAGSYTDAVTKLTYTLTLAAPTGGGTGTGADQAYTVNGSIAGGQGGDCTTSGGVCTNAGTGNNKQRTLTITY